MYAFRSFLAIVVLMVVSVGCAVGDDSATEAVTTTGATTTGATTTGATTTTEPATPTTAAPTATLPTTTVPDLSETEARDIVASAFAAFNSGDMDTWVLWREGGMGAGEDFSYQLAVESRLDVEQCIYRGHAEWEMDDPMIGHGFDCDVTYTDRFLEAAGIELEMVYNWVIGSDPESSLAGSNEIIAFAARFMGDYRKWLAANHPDVEASIQYEGEFPTADSVPTGLEYVDEFVAQSDTYPLTEPVPASNYGGPLS